MIDDWEHGYMERLLGTRNAAIVAEAERRVRSRA